MNRKVIKIGAILLTVLMIITMLATPVLAETADLSVSQFDNKGATGNAKTSVQSIIGAIITMVQIIGVGVAIIMLIVLAIKYISAAPSEKAEIKKTVTIYVVGAIVLFAASGILGIIKDFATDNIKAGSNTAEGATVEIVDREDIYLG